MNFGLKQFGLRDISEFAFSSCYMGLRKPEPRIYRRALDILGKPPERVVVYRRSCRKCGGAAAPSG